MTAENSNEIKIDSLDKFKAEILKFQSEEMVYRGQSDAKWDVTSSAYRRLKLQPPARDPTIEELLEYNKNLIERARRYAEELKETTTDLNFLAKLQHHGAATSLIDFTEAALIALWFACQDKNTYGKVFCLDLSDPTEFLEVSPEDEKESIDKILTLKFRKNKNNISSHDHSTLNRLAEYDKIAKWKPSIINNRILKQDSFFIFNEEGKLNNELFKIFILCKDDKKNILKELEQLSNFSEETIFPDFYGFAQNNGPNKLYGPQDAKEYFQGGNKNFASGKYEEAIENYTKAIDLNPQSAVIYSNRGLARSALAKYKEAIEDYTRTIKLNPQYAEAYCGRGAANVALKKCEEAIEDYDKAIELNPQYARAYYGRGLANHALKKYEEAITNYNKAIELDPQFATAYYGRGLANAALGKYEEAITNYNKAIELDPQDAIFYNNRGNANVALKKYEEAITNYNKAIELNPKYAEAYCNRGNANCILGKYVEGIKDYNKAIELDPQDAEAYKNRGNANHDLHKYKEAIENYDKAIDLDPQDAEAYCNRGNANHALGKYEVAIEDYTRAIKLNPQYPEAYFNRGKANRDLGKPEEAIKDYIKAKALFAEEENTEMVKKCEEAIEGLEKLIYREW